MLNNTPFAETNKAALDTMFSLSAAAFSGFEQLTALNLQVVKTTLEETAENSLAALSVKDPQAFMALQTGALQPAAEKVAAYGRQVGEIIATTKAEFEKVTAGQTAGMQKAFMSAVDAAAKNAPEGSGSGVAMFQTAMAAANNAFDGLQKAGRQASEVAEANYSAMSRSMVKASGNGKAKRA
jgi:phasin family protein